MNDHFILGCCKLIPFSRFTAGIRQNLKYFTRRQNNNWSNLETIFQIVPHEILLCSSQTVDSPQVTSISDFKNSERHRLSTWVKVSDLLFSAVTNWSPFTPMITSLKTEWCTETLYKDMPFNSRTRHSARDANKLHTSAFVFSKIFHSYFMIDNGSKEKHRLFIHCFNYFSSNSLLCHVRKKERDSRTVSKRIIFPSWKLFGT